MKTLYRMYNRLGFAVGRKYFRLLAKVAPSTCGVYAAVFEDPRAAAILEAHVEDPPWAPLCKGYREQLIAEWVPVVMDHFRGQMC